MAIIISVHSFRGGTGKSNLTANVAGLLALDGQRVGVIDTDIQSPGIHILFGLHGDQITSSLNDYLWGKSDIKDTAMDVTPNLGAAIPGHVYLIPASVRPGEITRVLREGYDAQRLAQGFRQLTEDLQLDALLIDTHPGLNEETLLSLVISHSLAIVMRPDQQDFEGTAVTVKIARELQVPNMLIVVNKAPAALDPLVIQTKVENAYGCPVGAVIPHSDEMMNLASEGIFSIRFPLHPVTQLYKQITRKLMEPPSES
jgi:septum site-determining protein MinD